MKRGLLALFLLGVLAVGGYVYWTSRSAALGPPPTEAELKALLAKRDELQARFNQVIAAKGEKSLAAAPRGGIMIGVPTSFTRSILEQVVTGLFGEVTLTLKNLKVHKAGEVKVKAVFGKKTVGKYVLDVQIPQVQGILRPGKPEVAFTRDRVALTLPVRLAEGGGTADIRLQWDSKGLAANMICGDLDVTKSVTGGVIPQEYTVGGAFKIGSTGDAITLAPDFPKEIEVRLFVDPSEQAWKAVEEVVKSRSGACQATLNKVDIKEILGNIVGRGFNVKIPQKLIKPVRLPAGVKQSLEIQGINLALQLKPTGLLVSSDRIWYGADLAFESQGKTKPAPAAKQ